MRRKGGGAGWREFYTSPPNFLSVQTLAPGQKAFWDWDRWDNEHQNRLGQGNVRVSLYIPQVRENPYQARFRLNREYSADEIILWF